MPVKTKKIAPSSESKPLDGRVAIVTGSTSGIGYGIAERLAASGCDVVLNGLGEKKTIDGVRTSLEKKSGRRVRFHGADMRKPDEIRALVEYARKELGSADILVNNAGIQHTARVEEFPADKWDAIIAINLSSAFHSMAAVMPSMRESGWGRIVNIASAHGLVASANKAAYVAAKHGLVGLTKVVALEAADSGITCNTVCPGWVRTPLVEMQIDQLAAQEGISKEEAADRLLAAKQPTGRFVEVEQVGELVVFLCSSAASNITGASYTIDGGWTAQ